MKNNNIVLIVILIIIVVGGSIGIYFYLNKNKVALTSDQAERNMLIKQILAMPNVDVGADFLNTQTTQMLRDLASGKVR